MPHSGQWPVVVLRAPRYLEDFPGFGSICIHEPWMWTSGIRHLSLKARVRIQGPIEQGAATSHRRALRLSSRPSDWPCLLYMSVTWIRRKTIVTVATSRFCSA